MSDQSRGQPLKSTAFPRLFNAVNATATEKVLLRAAYALLRVSIRNRDVHAYTPDVRDSHFNLVPPKNPGWNAK
jgi:hypothetical protein